MRNRQHARGTIRRGVPALALLGAALGLALSSTALAEDPIVDVGPLAVGGTTVSGSAHDDPAASVCIGDDQFDVGLSGSSLVVPTDAVCAASGGGSTSVSAARAAPAAAALEARVQAAEPARAREARRSAP